QVTGEIGESVRGRWALDLTAIEPAGEEAAALIWANGSSEESQSSVKSIKHPVFATSNLP
ncbi:MAG: hypothetical protein WC935_09235, partial [Thermoleophilia bacterium]